MRKKNDLSNLLSKKVDHQRKRHPHPNINANNIDNINNDSLENNNTNNNEPLQGTRKEIAKAALKASGLPPAIADYAERHPEQTKKVQGMITGMRMPTIVKLLPIIIPILGIFLFLMLFTVLFSDGQSSGINTTAFGGIYDYRCNEITVIFVDKKNGYTPIRTQTYSITDYVAGVIAAEMGSSNNLEVYKTFAVAARTYGLKNANEECAIEASARRQEFGDITDRTNPYADIIYQAVEETEGQVVLMNGELYPIQYDAFCFIDKDANYYTLAQQNQKIPVEWAEKHKVNWNEHYFDCPCNLKDESMTECWNGKDWKDGGHGRGISQYGASYLAKERDYTYDQILKYYYPDESITISSDEFRGSTDLLPEGIISIAGLEIKDTTKANYLQQPITEFLISKGSSLQEMNSFIHSSVKEKGAGTREGVVTAAVSMINYLYDNFNTKLPYYWNGSSGAIGLPSSFGKYEPSQVSRGGNVYYYKSFDCSGFVSWAIKNGGYNFSRIGTSEFDRQFSKNSCNITDSNCVGQPGDLINSKSGHVELIIAVDQENGKYFIAHSSGPGVVMAQRDMHKKNYGSNPTKILFMEEFYNNPMNVNHSY